MTPSLPPRRPLPRRFFARDTVAVARELLGCTLWTAAGGALCAGRIVETEAYLDQRDPASHAAAGPTARNRVMFGPAGVLYVYLIYGMHHCLNLVTEADGCAGAVLVRALEPLVGVDAMRGRRGARVADHRLCAGPGRLAIALGVDRRWNGLVLAPPPRAGVEPDAARCVWIAAGRPPDAVGAGPRIGIRRAAAAPWRFVDLRSPCLSRPAASGGL